MCVVLCRVAATAVVYFRRLYAGSSFSAHDPHLVAPGCLYLASKVGSLSQQQERGSVYKQLVL